MFSLALTQSPSLCGWCGWEEVVQFLVPSLGMKKPEQKYFGTFWLVCRLPKELVNVLPDLELTQMAGLFGLQARSHRGQW